MSVFNKLLHKNWLFSKETLKIANLAQLSFEAALKIFLKTWREPLMMELMYSDRL